jgi:hypothetical protein
MEALWPFTQNGAGKRENNLQSPKALHLSCFLPNHLILWQIYIFLSINKFKPMSYVYLTVFIKYNYYFDNKRLQCFE